MASRLTRGIYNWAAPLAQLAPPMLLNRCTRTTRHIAIRTHTKRVSIGWAKLKFRIKLLKMILFAILEQHFNG